ncbi:hypothetical protein ACFQT0_08670 [Hymenobacter humi]|uniref:Uncharacterized protein n=1 Tax=Hymenobacter humi TaxID=1411620 RepID=A0ABW2U4V6_9BACT
MAAPAAPVMRMANAAQDVNAPALAQPTAVVRGGWLQRYGVAAALALLVFAAGASEAWKSKHKAPELTAAVAPAEPSPLASAPDEALYHTGSPMAMTAADRTAGADSQLVRAVRGMETYYTTQLARRQSELQELSGPGMAAMNADWKREPGVARLQLPQAEGGAAAPPAARRRAHGHEPQPAGAPRYSRPAAAPGHGSQRNPQP